MNNHTISQQNFVSNNGDVSSGCGFINIHSHSQCEDSSIFKEMNGDVETGDDSSRYGSMKIHNN